MVLWLYHFFNVNLKKNVFHIFNYFLENSNQNTYKNLKSILKINLFQNIFFKNCFQNKIFRNLLPIKDSSNDIFK